MSLGYSRKIRLCCCIWRLLFTVIILVACQSIFADDSNNLIPNPGFELVDSNAMPVYWSNTADGPPKDLGFVSSDDSHSGALAMTSGHYLVMSEAIPVEPGCAYLLSVWVKSRIGSEQIIFGWQGYDATGKNISWGCYNSEIPSTTWKQFANVQFTDQNTAYIKIGFRLPWESVGTVCVDDFNMVKLDTQLSAPVGAVDSSSSETIDFGSSDEAASLVQYNSDAMGQSGIDGNIPYRELLPNKTLLLEFPAFNVDANGFPQSPMFLEIHYRDTIDNQSTSVFTNHRVFVSSGIYFTNPETWVNKTYYRIGSMGGSADNKWKYTQIAFSKSPFQLIRAVDGKFRFKIEMPQDANCHLPIDYVTLTSITQMQCDQIEQRQRLLNGFTQTELPSDQPTVPLTYNNLTVFTRDPMKPIYTFTKPDLNEITTNITSFTAKGLIEPLNFAIYSESGIENLSFQPSSLTITQTNAVISASQLSLWQVVCDNKYLNPYGRKKRFANIPDRLEPVARLNINAHASERLWLKIAVPDDAQAGVYTGHIDILKDGVLLERVNTSLNVLPFTLELPENLNPVYHSPYEKVICSDTNEVYKLYNEAGFDPFISAPWPHFIPIVSADVITGFDSARFEANLQKMAKKGFAKKAILVDTSSTWGTIYYALYDSDATQYISDPNLYDRLSDTRFVHAFSMAVQKYLQICSEHGLVGIFSVIDEPGADPFKRIVVDRLFKIIRDNGGFTNTTYWSQCDEPVNPGIFKIPANNGYGGLIPPLSDITDFKMWIAASLGPGYAKDHTNFGYYTTLTSYLRNPVYNRFLHGLLAFRTNARIVAAYAMGDWIGDPFNDFDADPSCIYPFTYPDFIFAYPTWSGKLLPTMGFEGIREGIKDARYIATLKKLIAANPKTPASIEANNYLNGLVRRINTDYLEAYIEKSDNYGFYTPIITDLSDSNNPEDFESFTKIRKTIADYIIQLQLAITKFTVKAGKTRGSSTDSFTIQGAFQANEQDVADGNTIYLGLRSGPDFVFEEDIPLNLMTIKKNKYSYKGSGGGIYSAVFDLKKKTFRIAARKIDLTGLSSPINVQIEWGNYRGQCQIDESTINGKQPIPVQLLTGYADVLYVDKASVRAGQTANKDSLAVQGRIAFKAAADLSQHSLILHWGSQSFVIPAGRLQKVGQDKYTTVIPKGTTGTVTQATFDLKKCTFKIIVKNATIISKSGVVECGIKVDTVFDQTIEYTLR